MHNCSHYSSKGAATIFDFGKAATAQLCTESDSIMNSMKARDSEQPPDCPQHRVSDINNEVKGSRALRIARQNFRGSNEVLTRICARLQRDGSYNAVKLTLALCQFRRARRVVSLLEAALDAL